MRHTDRVLILSQDYELFFHKSGTVEQCLFAPCDALLEFASARDLKYTFFVDAGMLLAMERYKSDVAELGGTLSKVQQHIESLANAGHEIALHIHPHWEDTTWVDGQWQFAGTRYQLREFAKDDIDRIVGQYSETLANLSGQMPTSYRAGGFCLEPFEVLGEALAKYGVTVDSSVVPGALLRDPDKGFNFGLSPDHEWWHFDTSPEQTLRSGRFVEIPITPQRLPFFYYWQRAVQRLAGPSVSESFGDGTSKRIGRKEIIRRLLGFSRTAELSVDDAKARHLLSRRVLKQKRQVWHVMGHPKLVSPRALQILGQFIESTGIERFATVTEIASLVRSRGRRD